MIKSGELAITGSGIDREVCEAEDKRNPELSRPSNLRIESHNAEGVASNKENEDKKEVPKFTMIFNKYNDKLNMKPSAKNAEDKSADKSGSKYTMIFNKDVTVRQKTEPSLSKIKDCTKSNASAVRSATDTPLKAIEPESSSIKLNDAEMLMNLYVRSNLFIPEITCSMLLETEDRGKAESKGGNDKTDSGLRLYNSLTSLSRNKSCRRGDTHLKSKISSMTSLEMTQETPRKHLSPLPERKLFRVRSLDLSESAAGSDTDSEKAFGFPKSGRADDDETRGDNAGESPRKSDKKSRGDATRKSDKENACRKQVQWKSEVDVIYFESHQAADGDRSGEILGRVIEPLREEWEQQRTGFYAKMVPLSLGSLNERWQSLLKI